MIQHKLVWKGIEYNSIERCLLTIDNGGNEISSRISGIYNDQTYEIEYLIRTSARWNVTLFELKARVSGNSSFYQYESDGIGNWKKDGSMVPAYKDCLDIDIPLTPFTNTLPINRLQLMVNESKAIKVLYLDVLSEEIKVLSQKYTRLSSNEYLYENVPNDFEAKVTVDESGFVLDYPGLFMRA